MEAKILDLVMPVQKVLVEKLIEVWKEAVSSIIANMKKFDGTGQKPNQVPRWPEKASINSYALLRAYVLMAVTGLGYLALTWSTVVLLGGFVTSLGRKDFWCLTGISMVQACRKIET
ncbi:uncharacterized protein LOC112268781 [Brachypodium distachyon]|uniref:Uncharacterized protein n=1 Tax=Brachypodium distachyon TaxID=15368 RepID=A0A2K2CPN0_BRADI|nr:uncharacterized protein LOC112268781 [Brachypodium distachyon]PNT63997.1 hypothetical protein BRADI_4g23321v3 [Brachypodium distachyon]|eukprot:XP_024310658.1 uncharacterized protein LOC112268781 [Brachypodium distachyon]